MPSTKTPTDCSKDWLAPTLMPLIEIIVFTAFSVILKFGTYVDSSAKLCMPASSIFVPLIAVKETGTSCRLSARFCAVTIISSSSAA